ncbi:protein CASC3 isoform X2 [Syngnathoides biaculeatus]|uniref:protein CASC3 isoform X2 n=1 Tax=Syngnathoides biaculeatus TaxID=300417 RepID=UPI002ADE823F|nr:protein CASC3 isoform X2 [Syngnathoides biaculeatus]
MADRRRRRRRASQDSDDDDESGSSSGSESRESGSQSSKGRGGRDLEQPEVASERVEAKEEVASECESEDGVGEAVLSDYDSADPEENASRSEGGEEEDADGFSDEEGPTAAGQSKHPDPAQPVRAEADEDGEERNKEKDLEEKGKSAGERQSGDGQESTGNPETKAGGQSGQQLDDDEDRKNPAYIPRKGLFFEHDVRGHAQEEERPKGRNRKLWKDEGRWEHDKFREEEQAPKSREELIASYGYDIRNGERTFAHRRPRSSASPNREQRWQEGGERAVRSWQSSRGGGGGGGGFFGRGGPPHRASPGSVPLGSSQRGNATRGRPSHLPVQPQFGGGDAHAPLLHPRERAGGKGPPVPAAASRGCRSGAGRAADDPPLGKDGEDCRSPSTQTPSVQQVAYRSKSPTQQPQEKRGGAAQPPHTSAATREASPPAERPVERKSYSLARRSRSRPAELGGKQTSVEEVAGVKNTVGGGALTELDQDVARLSLVSGQTWNQNPASYVHSQIRSCGSPSQPSSGRRQGGVSPEPVANRPEATWRQSRVALAITPSGQFRVSDEREHVLGMREESRTGTGRTCKLHTGGAGI